MAIDLSFSMVRKMVKEQYADLADDVDALASLMLLVGVAVLFQPATAAALSTAVGMLSNLFTVKNEFPKMGKRLIEKITHKKDNDPLALQQRMEIAYCLICYTAFFEALGSNKQLTSLVKQIQLTPEDKLALTSQAVEQAKVSTAPGKPLDGDVFSALDGLLAFPHPAESFEEQCERLKPLYQLLTKGVGDFLMKFSPWDALDERKHTAVREAIDKLPEEAMKCFQAEYYFLAAKYPEFFVWANLQNREDARKLLTNIGAYIQRYADAAANHQKAIDLGFQDLAVAVRLLPEQVVARIAASEIDDAVDELKKRYDRTIEQPIIDDPYEEDGQPHLVYPKRSQCFIPQAFQAIHYTGKESLEHEATWNNIPQRQDLGPFLLSYLRSPYSSWAPLIILGQPGSGKSLLTSMLAAQLFSSALTPIRIELRNTDADLDIESQIEGQIRKDTRYSINWAKFARRTRERPALVLFDGYDELLQASGKVFTGYLLKVQRFQQQEYEQERPTPAIVTSRITLIDKATIPHGATIVRLLEFDEERQQQWMSIWNTTNAAYFSQNGVKPFELPQNDEKVGELAKQPLLLLMLALYDSEGNQLSKTKVLDQTILYDRLLRQFIEREQKKDRESFESLSKKEREAIIERDMERLGVAAIGMFNRRTLHILTTQLSKDIAFFNLEKRMADTGGKTLTQAELLLGSFFFIQKSEALQKSGEQQPTDTAFEFLHNTFGEFLAADFMLRKILQQTDTISLMRKHEMLQLELAQKMAHFNALPSDWFACFMYAGLFLRPVIVRMMREWLQHRLQQKGNSSNEFLKDLDLLVASHLKLLLTGNDLPSIMKEREKYPFGDLPLVGYMAIYGLNLITLRTVLSPEGEYVFDEVSSFASQGGTRAWDRLTYLWRSWFSLETLSGLTAILEAERQGMKIHLRMNKTFMPSSSRDQLELVYNVSNVLADNITAGLAGLLLHDSHKAKETELDVVHNKLRAESIDLEVDVLTKQLRYLRRENVSTQAFRSLFNPYDKEVLFRNYDTAASLFTELCRLARWIDNRETLQLIGQIFYYHFPLRMMLTIEAITLAREIDDWDILEAIIRQFLRREGAKKVFLQPIEAEVELFGLDLGVNAAQQFLKRFREYLDKSPFQGGSMPTRLATVVIRKAREADDQVLLDYFNETYAREILRPDIRIPDDLAIELLKLARSTGNQEILRYFVANLNKRLGRLQRRTEPELVIALIQCACTIGELAVLLPPINGYIAITLEMKWPIPVELMTEILRLARETDEAKIWEHIEYYISELVKRKNILTPEVAIEILKLERERGDKRFLSYFVNDYLQRVLQHPERWVPIELAVELIDLAQRLDNRTVAEHIYQQYIAGGRYPETLMGLTLHTVSILCGLAKEFGDDELLKNIEQVARLKPETK